MTSSYRKKTRGGSSPYKQSAREPREQAPRRSTSRNGRGSSLPPAAQQQQPSSRQPQREVLLERQRGASTGNSIASSGVDSKIAHDPTSSRPRSSNYGGGGQGRVSTVPAPPGYIDMSVRDYHDRRGELQQRSLSRGDIENDNQSRASSVLTKESLVDHSHRLNGNTSSDLQQIQPSQTSPEADSSGTAVRHKLPSRGSKSNDSAGMTKMESAQRRLLFGDLDDIVDTNRGWQRNLRR